MQIINTSREFNEVEQYLLTLDQSITVLKNVEDGTSIPVESWLIFKDEKDGKETEILSIMDTDGNVYSCQSATFKQNLLNIWECMKGKPFAVIKQSGTTKAGRPFITCVLDKKSVSVGNKKNK